MRAVQKSLKKLAYITRGFGRNGGCVPWEKGNERLYVIRANSGWPFGYGGPRICGVVRAFFIAFPLSANCMILLIIMTVQSIDNLGVGLKISRQVSWLRTGAKEFRLNHPIGSQKPFNAHVKQILTSACRTWLGLKILPYACLKIGSASVLELRAYGGITVLADTCPYLLARTLYSEPGD